MDSRKRKIIQARVNEKEKKFIDDYIKRNNITISTFMRNALLEKAISKKIQER